jgi:hypothetical protein
LEWAVVLDEAHAVRERLVVLPGLCGGLFQMENWDRRGAGPECFILIRNGVEFVF